LSKNNFEINAKPLPAGLSLKSLISKVPPMEQLGNFTTVYIEHLVHFDNHPFKLYAAEKLEELAESIKQNGIINPVVVRKKKDSGDYEILSGHNRTEAARISGLLDIPVRIVEVDDDTAQLIVTESNLLQREKLLPSEKGRAYKMQLDVLKRQGKRTDLEVDHEELTSCQVGTKLNSAEIVAEKNNDSKRQVMRYVRMTSLNQGLLDQVDCENISFIAGVDLSYLAELEQDNLFSLLSENEAYKITLETAGILKSISKTEQLSFEKMKLILDEQNHLSPSKEKVKKEISPYTRVIKKVSHYLQKLPNEQMAKSLNENELEDVIIQAIEVYLKSKQ
jgi:ParB family chromosome partitioning protein